MKNIIYFTIFCLGLVIIIGQLYNLHMISPSWAMSMDGFILVSFIAFVWKTIGDQLH